MCIFIVCVVGIFELYIVVDVYECYFYIFVDKFVKMMWEVLFCGDYGLKVVG